MRKSFALVLGILVLLVLLCTSCKSFPRSSKGEEDSAPFRRYEKEAKATDAFEVYCLIRLYMSQERSLDILASIQEWYRTHPTGPGSEELGGQAFSEGLGPLIRPPKGSKAEQLNNETYKLNQAIFDASPYYSDRINMIRWQNKRRIDSVVPKFKTLHARTRATLVRQWSALRKVPASHVLTKRDQTHMQVYEAFFDMFPEQTTEQDMARQISNRYEDYLAGEEEDSWAGSFKQESSELSEKRRTLKSLRTSQVEGDAIVQRYFALYDQRVAALKELHRGWTMRSEKTVAAASDDYVRSILGFQDLRKDIEIVLVGKVAFTPIAMKSRGLVKLPEADGPEVAAPIYVIAQTLYTPKRYFLAVVDSSKDEIAGTPIKLPIQPISVVRLNNFLLLKDSTRLLFYDTSRDKFADQMLVPESGSIELVRADENRVYLETGVFGSTVVDTAAKVITDQRRTILHPFGSFKSEDGRQLIVALEQTNVRFRYAVTFYDATTYERVGDSVELPNTPTQLFNEVASSSCGSKVYVAMVDMRNMAGTEVRRPGQNLAIISTATRELSALSIHFEGEEPDTLHYNIVSDLATGPDGTIYMMGTGWYRFWVWILDNENDRVVPLIAGAGEPKPKSLLVGNDQKLYVAVRDTRREYAIEVYKADTGDLIRKIKMANLEPWLLFK